MQSAGSGWTSPESAAPVPGIPRSRSPMPAVPRTVVSTAGSIVCRSQGDGSRGTARDSRDGAGCTGRGWTGARAPMPRVQPDGDRPAPGAPDAGASGKAAPAASAARNSHIRRMIAGAIIGTV
ncbi:hypothetical protein D9M68_746040 [compost metagenome]